MANRTMVMSVVTNNQREHVDKFLDDLKSTVMDQLERGAAVDIAIDHHTRDIHDVEHGSLIVEKVFLGMKWTIDIPNMATSQVPVVQVGCEEIADTQPIFVCGEWDDEHREGPRHSE